MGLFRRQQCEKDLEDACRAIGNAAGQVAVGETERDFLDAVVESQRQRLAASFNEVKQLKGERKALGYACDTASAWTIAPLEVRDMPSNQAKAEVETLIRSLCAQTP